MQISAMKAAVLGMLPLLGQCAELTTMATCTMDACLSAVESNRQVPRSEAVAGCTSFFNTHITPVVTRTATHTVTVTTDTTVTRPTTVHTTVHPTATRTVPDKTTSTVSVTSVTTHTTTTTVRNVQTQQVTKTNTITSRATKTVTNTDTHTDTSTATSTTTVATVDPPKPSDLGQSPSKRDESEVQAPAPADNPSPATTITRTNALPSYATAACNSPAYSSACSCVGVTQQQVTRVPSTTVTTTTTIQTAVKTSVVQPTVTATFTGSTTTITHTSAEATVTHTVHSTTTATATVTKAATVTHTTTVKSTSFTTVATRTTTSTTTTVSTKTTTVSATATATPGGDCANQGMKWALHHNPFGDADGPNYPSFDPNFFKTDAPLDSGITPYLGGFGFPAGDDVTIFGSVKIPSTYFALEQVGYFVAPVDGSYTFSAYNVDDVAMLWTGGKAYSGWTTDNTDLKIINSYASAPSFTINMNAGEFLPFRALYGQAQGYARFFASIGGPNGDIITDHSLYTDSMIRFSCDQARAPPFPEFGSEL